MCSTSTSGGVAPWRFQTTIGTPHTSQSATQHTSSSWYQVVIRAASHSSQLPPELARVSTAIAW